MARLRNDGAEMQILTAGFAFEGINQAPNIAIDTTVKRSGAASYQFTSDAADSVYLEYEYGTGNSAPGAVRAYFRFESFPTDTNGAIIQMLDGGLSAVIASISIETNGTLKLWDGSISGTQRGSASAALSLNTWYGIELKVQNGGSPEIEARLWEDGVTTPSAFASGAMTAASDPGAVDIGFADFQADAVMNVDDIACNDNSGSAQTGYPGEGKLVLALPTGAGDNAATTGIYSYINEIPPSNTATSGSTMIELDTNTSIGDYAMTDSSTLGIGSGDAITLVEVLARIREEAAGTSNYTLRLKSASGGTVSASASVDAGNATARTNPSGLTAFATHLVSYLDPTTGSAWTPTGTNSIDNMQAGVATTDGTPDIWCLWLGAYIEYVPAAGTTYTPTYTETVTLVDTVVKSTTKLLTDVATLVDTVNRSISRTLTDVATLVDTVLKSLTRTLSDVVTMVDTFTGAIIYNAVLTEIITVTDSIVRSISRTLSETATLVDSVLKGWARTLEESVIVVDLITTLRTAYATLTEVVTLVDTIIRDISRTFSETATMVDTLLKSWARSLSEIVTLEDTFIGKITVRVLTEVVTVTDTLLKSISRTFSEVVTLVDTLLKLPNKILSEVVTLVDTFTNLVISTYANLVESITVTDTLELMANKVIHKVKEFIGILAQKAVGFIKGVNEPEGFTGDGSEPEGIVHSQDKPDGFVRHKDKPGGV